MKQGVFMSPKLPKQTLFLPILCHCHVHPTIRVISERKNIYIGQTDRRNIEVISPYTTVDDNHREIRSNKFRFPSLNTCPGPTPKPHLHDGVSKGNAAKNHNNPRSNLRSPHLRPVLGHLYTIQMRMSLQGKGVRPTARQDHPSEEGRPLGPLLPEAMSSVLAYA